MINRNPNVVVLVLLIVLAVGTLSYGWVSHSERPYDLLMSITAMYLVMKICGNLVMRQKPKNGEEFYAQFIPQMRLVAMPIAVLLATICLVSPEAVPWLTLGLTIAALSWGSVDVIAESRKNVKIAGKES